MSRDVRYDLDSGRYLDYPLPGTPPPPGWIERMEAHIEALPVALRVCVGPGYILCPDCALDPEAQEAESWEIDEDGTFGVRSCEWCGQEVRAR